MKVPKRLSLALHDALPEVGGSQSDQEISYEGYARVIVDRDRDFTRDNAFFCFRRNIDFPMGLGERGDYAWADHWSVADATTEKIIAAGPLAGPLFGGANVIPRLTYHSSFTPN